MKTRTDLLNHLVSKFGLMRYLEIGVQDATQNFDKVLCSYKIGVDPDPNSKATFCHSSDAFFYHYVGSRPVGAGNDLTVYIGNDGFTKFDLIFIDGLHTAEQVKKDFENSLKILSPNGFIVLHDCNPEKEEHTIVPRPTPRGHWNGDVYKFAVQIKHKITVDIDNGCSVIQPYSHNILYVTMPETKDVEWNYFNEHRKKLLNLITWDEFLTISPHI